jgi:hypothetical protein
MSNLKKENFQEDVVMSSNEENKDQEMIPDSHNSNEIIVADSSLRNLFQLGYNSRSLTKTIVNSIKFYDVVENIKSYLEKDELSVKAAGPLLLGLTRVYDKQIKILNEELTTMFQIKRGEKPDPGLKNKNEDKVSKSKLKKVNLDSTEDHSFSQNGSGSKSFFNAGLGMNKNNSNNLNSLNKILSLSPLNEGLFSLLNNKEKGESEGMTPSKFLNSESASKSPNTAGMFRAQNDSANPDSKNKFNINMINSNFKNSNMIMEKSIFEEENQDVNNFFQFISENVNLNKENLDLGEDIPVNLDFDFNATEMKTEDLAKQLVFNSDSKSLLTMNNLANDIANFKSKNKKIPVNTIFEYDEDVEIDNEAGLIDEGVEEPEEIMGKFRNLLKLSTVDYSYLLKEKPLNTFYNSKDESGKNTGILKEDPHKESLPNREESEPDDTLLNNFSNLDFKDFGFNEDNFLKEKLNKILEEEKNEKKEKEEKENMKDYMKENYQDEFNQNNEDFNNNFNNPDEFNQFPEVENSSNLENFKNSLNSILKLEKTSKKKPKEISFPKLTQNLQGELPPHQIFYNLLCLAQKDNTNFNLEQDEVFKNEAIRISNI